MYHVDATSVADFLDWNSLRFEEEPERVSFNKALYAVFNLRYFGIFGIWGDTLRFQILAKTGSLIWVSLDPILEGVAGI